MSDDDTKDFELDGHALAMIAAYQREESMPATVNERVWERVESDVAVPAASSTALKWGVVLVAAAAAIAVAVLGASTLGPSEDKAGGQQAPYGVSGDASEGAIEDAPRIHAEREPAPVEQAARVDAIEAPVDAIAPVDASAPVDAPVEAIAAAPERASKPRVRRPARDDAAADVVPTDAPPEQAPPVPADTLADELRLLERAHGALAADRPNDALSIVAEHKRRFPAGRLLPERAAVHAIALCDAGRSAEGTKAADAFLATHAGHALAKRVRRACDR